MVVHGKPILILGRVPWMLALPDVPQKYRNRKEATVEVTAVGVSLDVYRRVARVSDDVPRACVVRLTLAVADAVHCPCEFALAETKCSRHKQEWITWERRFECYRIATGLNAKDESEQVNMLIYLLGDEADDIFLSFRLSTADSAKYNVVLEKFCQYFIGRRNIIFDRAQINKQRCSYGELKEELIRDRLVVGVRNLSLSEKLQLIPDLTMDKAIEIAKQTEAVRMQQKSLRDDCLAETNVNFVKKQNKSNFSKIKGSNLKHDERSIPGNSKAWYQAGGAKACTRCGSPKFHKFEHCPAFMLHGHFMKQCKTKLVSQVTTKDDNDKFLGNFCIDQISSDEILNCKVAVNKIKMPFKIDTGADVSVMPENCFKQNFSHQLGKTQKRLYAAGMVMPVLGNFQATLEANGKVSHEEIYVVKNLHVSLLSAKASEELGFIQRLLHVNSNPLTDPLKDYPELFSGLGKTK
ncbi:hypothetical protein LAZ67_20002154 [Cordylochernes scorpioides]|uniref:Peptidase A2 domain-containing protein n=1 Tax=Cordylochernes scorpioides TaxID=51811 RepID=A0ABY6LKK2_9ARAC|nr:hypothetical protein LAZ67_20002154 [Cordylochernes scorpioides]